MVAGGGRASCWLAEGGQGGIESKVVVGGGWVGSSGITYTTSEQFIRNICAILTKPMNDAHYTAAATSTIPAHLADDTVAATSTIPAHLADDTAAATSTIPAYLADDTAAATSTIPAHLAEEVQAGGGLKSRAQPSVSCTRLHSERCTRHSALGARHLRSDPTSDW